MAQFEQQAHQASSAFPHRLGLLQRKCACGGSPGVDGVCEECRSQKLSLQRSKLNLAESPQLSSPRQHALSSFSRVQIRSATPGPIQAKLAISQPGDRYEQEADHVAEQVMRVIAPEPSSTSPRSNNGHSEDSSLILKDGISTSAQGIAGAPYVVNEVLNSGNGQPLDSATRAFMEPRFGFDFSTIRIHTGDQAAAAADSVNANAFTIGQNIVFASGSYRPHVYTGRRLLAHELTHVIQQSRGGHHTLPQTPRHILGRTARDAPGGTIKVESASTPYLARQFGFLKRLWQGIRGKGDYQVPGLGDRKKAILRSGGTDLDMAVAMQETENMLASSYPYGDIDPQGRPKTLDAANFGIFKQNWLMIRTSVSQYANKTARDWNLGAALNNNLNLDIQVLHASQGHYGMNQWFAGHRNGPSGLANPNTADINNYKNAVYWIRDQIRKDPKYLTDDTRFWVKVKAI